MAWPVDSKTTPNQGRCEVESQKVGSAPAEVVESVVVDAEVVSDLVDDRDGDLLLEVLAVLAEAAERAGEQDDPVGERASTPAEVTLGEGDTLVDAEQVVRLVGGGSSSTKKATLSSRSINGPGTASKEALTASSNSSGVISTMDQPSRGSRRRSWSP